MAKNDPHSSFFLKTNHYFLEPNDESAANVDAAKTWREDKARFNSLALRSVRISLGISAE